MHIIFFDLPQTRDSLKPFTLTRPIAQIRVGIWTIADKWVNRLSHQILIDKTGYLTESYLQEKFPLQSGQDNLLIDGSICPDAQLIASISQLSPGCVLRRNDKIIAVCIPEEDLQKLKRRLASISYTQFESVLHESMAGYQSKAYQSDFVAIQYNWDIFQNNTEQIAADFSWITSHRTSAGIDDPHTIVYNPDNIFVEEGVSIKASIINAEEGPVYIGRNATVHENAVIKGPFAMLEGAHINIGSKIRDATTVGPYCKIGGEVKNTVFFANSNKGHDGFLGNAVVGEWCNFGADTNCSNLKNNYKPVSIWHYGTKSYKNTGLLFCGLMMGDHSKCGINTMFNTGTVVGVSSNIFGSDYTPKFIPSFTWGNIHQQEVYDFQKALEVAKNVIERRGMALNKADEAILQHIFEHREQEV